MNPSILPYVEHPADVVVRDELTLKLVALRMRHGMSQHALAGALDVGIVWCEQAESGHPMTTLSRTFMWAKVFRHELVIRTGLEDVDYAPWLSAWGEVTRLVAKGTLDPYWRSSFEVERAVGLRRAFGLTNLDMQSRLGVKRNAVGDWESGRKACILPGLQRYIRALGGSVRVDLVSVR